jgi:hypothetical protein
LKENNEFLSSQVKTNNRGNMSQRRFIQEITQKLSHKQKAPLIGGALLIPKYKITDD